MRKHFKWVSRDAPRGKWHLSRDKARDKEGQTCRVKGMSRIRGKAPQGMLLGPEVDGVIKLWCLEVELSETPGDARARMYRHMNVKPHHCPWPPQDFSSNRNPRPRGKQGRISDLNWSCRIKSEAASRVQLCIHTAAPIRTDWGGTQFQSTAPYPTLHSNRAKELKARL